MGNTYKIFAYKSELKEEFGDLNVDGSITL
jgi:hypothetical protein